MGNEIRTLVNAIKERGRYNIKLSGMDLVSGVYFVNILTDHFSKSQKILLIK